MSNIPDGGGGHTESDEMEYRRSVGQVMVTQPQVGAADTHLKRNGSKGLNL